MFGGQTWVTKTVKKIPLIRPYITEEVKKAVCQVLDSGYLTEGPVTARLEESFKDYIGCKHAIAATSCTTGLEIALRAMQIGRGDEVIVPAYTYPATASVVALVGATIVMVDVDPANMLIDYDAIENAITSKTKAVIPVSLFGNPLDYDRLKDIKDKFGLYILEDAACSIGARFDGVAVGGLADISVFSLHPRKFITTGEGGMITTNNTAWAKWMQSYKHFGMGAHDTRKGTTFERFGTNCKLSDIQAAVGLVQMLHIDTLLAKRTALSHNYYILMGDKSGIAFPKVDAKGTHSWQSCCVFVENRNNIIERLRKANIETQIGTYSLPMHKAFQGNPDCRILGEMHGSRYAFDHCLTLPVFHDMTERDQDYVVDSLVEAMQ